MVEPSYGIKSAAQKSGLTAHVIRIWEKRYQAVTPLRTGTNRRLYGPEAVERLTLLKKLTQGGHSIGNIATLPTEVLRKMDAETTSAEKPKSESNVPVADRKLYAEALHAVRELDAKTFEDCLKQSEVALGSHGVLQRVIAPLAEEIGIEWRNGTITAAHEHFATALIRVFLSDLSRQFTGSQAGPHLVVATLPGQLHELGALIAATAAANSGWQVTYLGVSLPVADIAGAVRQVEAKALALSLVYPSDDPKIEGDFARLRELIPAEVAILAGGRAATSYQPWIEKSGGTLIKDLPHFLASLDALRAKRFSY